MKYIVDIRETINMPGIETKVIEGRIRSYKLIAVDYSGGNEIVSLQLVNDKGFTLDQGDEITSKSRAYEQIKKAMSS